MLKFSEVKKEYDNFTLNCSLEVKPGMVTGLIGANGAGKSTTFKAALDLISIDSGQITVFGKDYKELTAEDKEKIGVVLAESGFSEYLTVADVAAILCRMYSRFSKVDFFARCNAYGLPLNKKIKEFSTGMKAKLKLLVAISHGAELLLLDEPTAGLDVVAREELLALLQDYLSEEAERAVVISSHISTDLEKFCDDIYMISDGEIILHEETDVLLDSYGIVKLEESQYETLDKSALLCCMKENFGYSLLTSDRQFYQENNPMLIVEKCGIDQVILMMTRGVAIC